MIPVLNQGGICGVSSEFVQGKCQYIVACGEQRVWGRFIDLVTQIFVCDMVLFVF